MALWAAQERFILNHAYSEVFCEHLPPDPLLGGTQLCKLVSHGRG